MNNDKKIPQDKNLDQKQHQVTDKGIGQPHGMDKAKPAQPSQKPEANKEAHLPKPQSANLGNKKADDMLEDDKDLDDKPAHEVDDDDSRITQRSSQSSKPAHSPK